MENLEPDKENQDLQQQQSFSELSQEEQQQQNTTYYYSNFDLFGDANKFTYLKYQRFMRKLKQNLGTDWDIYARQVVYLEVEGKKTYWTDLQIFDQFNETWLELRYSFHKARKNSIDERSHDEDIKFFEENGMYQSFLKNIANKLQGYQIEQWSFKPVANGFFMAAVSVWNETLEDLKRLDQLGGEKMEDDDIDEEEQIKIEEEEEQKILKQEENSSFVSQKILNTVHSTVQSTLAYTQNYKIVKPLMVATEKILNYLKPTKTLKTEHPKTQKLEDMSEHQKEGFSNFKNNLFSEEEFVLDKIKNLKLEEQPVNRKRRNSELSQEKPSVELKKFSRKEEKSLQSFVVKAAEQYIQSIKQTTQEKWQVARGFVTNIIELNNSMLQKTLEIPNTLSNNINIRFLQPAQGFYNHLLEVWILFKNKQNNEKNFKEYLEKVKQSFGTKWNEQFLLPTQMFFQTLVFTWEKIMVDKNMADKEESEIAKHFIENLRENMHQDWEQKVVSTLKNMPDQQETQNN